MSKNHGCPTTDQPAFLWCLLCFYFIKHSLDDVINLVSTIYEQSFEFTPIFENIILKLWETADIQYVFAIAKEAIIQRIFNIEEHVFIIAILVEKKQLNICDAARLLIFETPHNSASLTETVRRVIDVAWLVNEDNKDGVMTPNDDNILLDALTAVRLEYSK